MSALLNKASAMRPLGTGKAYQQELLALIDGEPRSATCVATEPSVLLALTQAGFQRLCEERPALALKLLTRIAKLMSRRLRQTSGRLVDYLDA